MTPKETYKLAAILKAHQLLIGELLIFSFAQLPDPLSKFKAFRERLTKAITSATVRGVDPARSDAIAQETADAVSSILEESEKALALLLKGH